jgi:putative N6-adenine-specific DNA methylase
MSSTTSRVAAERRDAFRRCGMYNSSVDSPGSSNLYDAFAVTAPGLEAIVSNELRTLRATRIRTTEGGVEFRASRALLYTANLRLRAASRVVVRLASFHASSFAELERRARRIEWDAVVPRGGRVRLRVTCRKSRLYHSDAVAERVAGAITSRAQVRVDRKTPDAATHAEDDGVASQLLVVRVDHDECTISVDTSGALLHQRGYRLASTQAPLRETLAAALVLATGWNDGLPFLDPFCGSGTIAIEAALIARRLAPGRDRQFRFMAWPDFDATLWNDVVARAREEERPSAAGPIFGTDRSGWAMRAATGNAERAGVSSDVAFTRSDATQLAPPTTAPGWIVTNPPYGVRLGARDELRKLYAGFGSALRAHFARWHLGMLSTDRTLDAQMRVPLLERLQTTNGGIRVHLLVGLVA